MRYVGRGKALIGNCHTSTCGDLLHKIEKKRFPGLRCTAHGSREPKMEPSPVRTTRATVSTASKAHFTAAFSPSVAKEGEDELPHTCWPCARTSVVVLPNSLVALLMISALLRYLPP